MFCCVAPVSFPCEKMAHLNWSSGGDPTSAEPVFLLKNDIVNGKEKYASTLEICVAAEVTTGRGTVVGAQPIGGLWRIYPKTRAVRNELLIKGFNLRNTSVRVHGTNPFVMKDDRGMDIPTTKVWIDDIPISVATSEVEFSLKRLGCEMRSKIMLERARDNDNKLTRFLTGRRFVFINTPSTPLDKLMPVGDLFKAKVFHKEQKQTKRSCTRCFAEDHEISQCTNEIVCRVCHVSGHRSGDEACDGASVSAIPPPRALHVRRGRHGTYCRRRRGQRRDWRGRQRQQWRQRAPRGAGGQRDGDYNSSDDSSDDHCGGGVRGGGAQVT